jgi:hypothetical protein
MKITDIAMNRKLGGGANIDVSATVGQTIRVKEVDADGKPTAWEAVDYQPRTHWTGLNETVLCEDVKVLGIAEVNILPFVEGRSYHVIYKHDSVGVVEYDCIGKIVYNRPSIGNACNIDPFLDNTGEYFFAMTMGDNLVSVMAVHEGALVTIIEVGETVHPLDKKYIEKHLPYAIDVLASPEKGQGTTTAKVTDVEQALLDGRDIIVKLNYDTSGAPTVILRLVLIHTPMPDGWHQLSFASVDSSRIYYVDALPNGGMYMILYREITLG